MLRSTAASVDLIVFSNSTSLITTTTNRGTTMRRRKRSKCEMGVCGYHCHRIKVNAGSWLRSGPTRWFTACNCEDRCYQWTVFAFGRFLAIQAEVRKAGEACFSWAITPKTTVRYTSPGFRVLKECRRGKITAEEAAQRMVVLRDMGIISTKDVDPSGQGYYDVCTGGTTSIV